MAFGRLERNPGGKPMSDINMTPLIDVMLVLLVIFIITAPLIGTRLPLQLPKVDSAAPMEAVTLLELALDAEGQSFIGAEASSLDQIRRRAKAAAAADPQTEVQLRADEKVPYGKVAELIGLLQEAGLSRIGFVTERAASTASPQKP